ncbi:MAG: hypothetical protein RH946_03480 [Rhodospirillales bacterium]
MIADIVLILASLLLLGVFLHPRLRRAPLWQATVTPLASIIGSGFLVAGPILAHVAGTDAWMAMVGLCAIAYLFGTAIRFNIIHAEPMLLQRPPRMLVMIEGASDAALSLAYFVSVAYYLNLFAAFGLRLADIIDPVWIQGVATAVIATFAVVGTLGGLNALERFEVYAVGVKLSVIGGLCLVLGLVSIQAMGNHAFEWEMIPHTRGVEEIGIFLGLVILVQGFETSRYLGGKYDAATRVRTMRWAQWLSSGIYMLFILLITSFFTTRISGDGGETAIIDMLGPVGTAIAPVIILAALASQSTAAVADMSGAGGLVSEITRGRLSINIGTLLTALVAIGITWATNIYEIIAYASKAFVAYYALQSAEAAYLSLRSGQWGRLILFGCAVAVAVVIFIFAIPAEI